MIHSTARLYQSLTICMSLSTTLYSHSPLSLFLSHFLSSLSQFTSWWSALLVVFTQQVMTNPRLYSRDSRSFLKLLQVTSMLSDAVCIDAIVATSSDHQTAVRQKKPLLLDGKGGRSGKSHHIFEAVHILNEKLEEPRKALTNSSLLAAIILLVVSIRHYLVLL